MEYPVTNHLIISNDKGLKREKTCVHDRGSAEPVGMPAHEQKGVQGWGSRSVVDKM
jgi:hypothetical protein